MTLDFGLLKAEMFKSFKLKLSACVLIGHQMVKSLLSGYLMEPFYLETKMVLNLL